MLIFSKSSGDTKKFGEELGKKLLKTGGIVCLYGNLGAGKTTFIQGLAKGLKIKQRVNSPTFIIARQYNNFFHVDLYRLKTLVDAKNLGIEEMWSTNNVVCIEWPEIIEGILPKHIKVIFKTINENERQIEIIY